MPADHVVVERRLLVDEVRRHLVARQRGLHDVGDEGRVVTGPLDGLVRSAGGAGGATARSDEVEPIWAILP